MEEEGGGKQKGQAFAVNIFYSQHPSQQANSGVDVVNKICELQKLVIVVDLEK